MLNVRRYAAYTWLISIPLLLCMQFVNAANLPKFTDLVKETSAAVVNISTTQKIKTGLSQLPDGFEMPKFP